MLPSLLSDALHPSIIAFVVVYGLDWVATVPPTAALCREAFGQAGSVVFGWVFAAHQIGAAVVSVGAGVIRDTTGQYAMAWVGAACLCLVAAFVSSRVGGPASRSALDRAHGEATSDTCLVHVWATRHRNRSPAVHRSPRSQVRFWGNEPGCRTLIRMSSTGHSPLSH